MAVEPLPVRSKQGSETQNVCPEECFWPGCWPYFNGPGRRYVSVIVGPDTQAGTATDFAEDAAR